VTLFLNHKKYLVAASLLFAIVTGSLFINKAENTNNSIVKNVETIEIENLPDELIEAYVNNNELVAEVEWNSAIEAAGTNLISTNQ
jgi:predicted house-cleaning NTP pyrophosphatase (Maf/HAM1 superfamily)